MDAKSAGKPAADAKLDVGGLMDDARRLAGLDDFGDPWFVEPLTKLVEFINAEADLPSRDVYPVKFLINTIADRLRLTDYLKRHPKVRDEDVCVAGVIVSGRGGSTFIHRLLGSSSQVTAPRFFETRVPVPLPGEKPGHIEARLAIGRARVDEHNAQWPEFKSIHPLDAMAYEEEIHLMNRGFVSQMYPSYFPIRSYNHWETTIDQTKVYEDLKLWLQVLQYQASERRGRTWVLKSVQHLLSGGVPHLLRVFPQAKVIMTHRNLVDVMSSWCSAQSVLLRAAQSTTFKAAELGPRVMQMYLEGLQLYLRAREQFPAERFVDVTYRRLMRNPLGEFKRVLELLNFKVTPADETAASEWLSKNGRDTHPPHHYRPEDYGLTREMLESTFKFYHDRFVKEPEQPGVAIRD
jgi:hypothetical protein